MASAAPASPDADIGRPHPAPAPAPSSPPRPKAQLGTVSETAVDVLLGPRAADRAKTFRDGQPGHLAQCKGRWPVAAAYSWLTGGSKWGGIVWYGKIENWWERARGPAALDTAAPGDGQLRVKAPTRVNMGAPQWTYM